MEGGMDKVLRPRTAPSPERHERMPGLDVVVVIPSYQEGANVVRMLKSIALQKGKSGKGFGLAGAVVVINGRPDDSAEVKKSNMQTYAVLQSMRFGFPVDVGSQELNEMIEDIQESGLAVEVVDAFSDGNAHPENTVGYARKVGTEHALSKLRRDAAGRLPKDSFIVSSDADSWLGSKTLAAVHSLFAQSEADIISLPTRSDTQNLDWESYEANKNYSLYWHMRGAFSAIDTIAAGLEEDPQFGGRVEDSEPEISRKNITAGGAYTAVRALAYEQSDGYDASLTSGEDTGLAESLVDAGSEIQKLSEDIPGAFAATQSRISERTGKHGYGRTIQRFNELKTPFTNIQVDNPHSIRERTEFFREVSSALEGVSWEEAAERVRHLCSEHELSLEDTEKLMGHFAQWNGVVNGSGHNAFLRTADTVFDAKHGDIEMGQMIEMLESENERLSKTLGETFFVRVGTDDEDLPLFWERFQEIASHPFERLLAIEGGNPKQQSAINAKIRALVAAAYPTFIRNVMLDTKIASIFRFQKEMETTSSTPERMAFMQEFPEASPEEFKLICEVFFSQRMHSILDSVRNLAVGRLSTKDLQLVDRVIDLHDAHFFERWEKYTQMIESYSQKA